MAFWHGLPKYFWRGVSIVITISDLELGTIRSTANLANWENEKSHGQNFGKRRLSKSSLPFVSTLAEKTQKLGLDLGESFLCELQGRSSKVVFA